MCAITVTSGGAIAQTAWLLIRKPEFGHVQMVVELIFTVWPAGMMVPSGARQLLPVDTEEMWDGLVVVPFIPYLTAAEATSNSLICALICSLEVRLL